MLWILEENYQETRICSVKKHIHELFKAVGDRMMSKSSNVPNLWFRRSGSLKRAREQKEEKRKKTDVLSPVPGKASPLSLNHSKHFSGYHQEKELVVKYRSEKCQIHLFLC